MKNTPIKIYSYYGFKKTYLPKQWEEEFPKIAEKEKRVKQKRKIQDKINKIIKG